MCALDPACPKTPGVLSRAKTIGKEPKHVILPVWGGGVEPRIVPGYVWDPTIGKILFGSVLKRDRELIRLLKSTPYRTVENNKVQHFRFKGVTSPRAVVAKGGGLRPPPLVRTYGGLHGLYVGFAHLKPLL